MSDNFFLDTNLFVYSFAKEQPRKQEIAIALIENGLETQRGLISYQVIQEFLNVTLGKFKKPLTLKDVKEYMWNVLIPLWQISSSIHLFEIALTIKKERKFSFYDSLIIAAAIEGKCDVLYSEDMQHGQLIEGMTIVNPFGE